MKNIPIGFFLFATNELKYDFIPSHLNLSLSPFTSSQKATNIIIEEWVWN